MQDALSMVNVGKCQLAGRIVIGNAPAIPKERLC